MTVLEFYNNIYQLPKQFKNRDLEEYLSALYLICYDLDTKNKLDALDLFSMFKKAFSSEAAPFDKEWLSIIRPPILESEALKNPESAKSYSLEVLKFQIAELHKMKGKQLMDEQRYFGVISESNHRWFNFDPFNLLECGMRGLFPDADSDDSALEVNLSSLGEILEMGRCYE